MVFFPCSQGHIFRCRSILLFQRLASDPLSLCPVLWTQKAGSSIQDVERIGNQNFVGAAIIIGPLPSKHPFHHLLSDGPGKTLDGDNVQLDQSPIKSVATCDMQPGHRLLTPTHAESVLKITSRSLLASAFCAWLQRTGSASVSLWSVAKRG